MEPEQNNSATDSELNTSVLSIVLSALSIFGSAGGVIIKNPIMKSLSYVVAFAFIIVASNPGLFCKTKVHLKKLNKIINLIFLSITLLAVFFSFSGGTLVESCGGPSPTPIITPIITPTPISEIPDPSGKIAAGNDFSMLLRSNGKVDVYGNTKLIDTSKWEHIVQITAYGMHAAGLCENGHVVVAANSPEDYKVESWRDIKRVVACEKGIIGVTNSGHVLFEGPNSGDIRDCTNWTGVERILGAAKHIIAVDKYGTLLKVGDNQYQQLDFRLIGTVIAAAAANDSTFLVYQDGNVYAKGKHWGTEDDVSGWSDIRAVAGGDKFTVGLCGDGTLRLAGDDSYNKHCVRGWRNIIAVCAGQNHVVAIDQAGRVYSKGYDDNGRCGIDGKNYWVSN